MDFSIQDIVVLLAAGGSCVAFMFMTFSMRREIDKDVKAITDRISRIEIKLDALIAK